MSSRSLLASLLALWFAAPGLALAGGDPAAGQAKAAACAACHGADGNSSNPEWPKLAGQHAGYLEKQLHEFKAGTRVNAVMNGMAAPLSDQDIADLAAFYAGQETRLGVADQDAVPLGQRLYRGGNASAGLAACMSCHGPAGTGNPLARFPRLSGQHAEYTAKSLRDYRAGTRANDPNAMMRGVAERLTDKEIEALSQYIAGLHG